MSTRISKRTHTVCEAAASAEPVEQGPSAPRTTPGTLRRLKNYLSNERMCSPSPEMMLGREIGKESLDLVMLNGSNRT